MSNFYLTLIKSYIGFVDRETCVIRNSENIKELYSILNSFMQNVDNAHTYPFIVASLHALYRVLPEIMGYGFEIEVFQNYMKICNKKNIQIQRCRFVDDEVNLCTYCPTIHPRFCVYHHNFLQKVSESLDKYLVCPIVHIIREYLHI